MKVWQRVILILVVWFALIVLTTIFVGLIGSFGILLCLVAAVVIAYAVPAFLQRGAQSSSRT